MIFYSRHRVTLRRCVKKVTKPPLPPGRALAPHERSPTPRQQAPDSQDILFTPIDNGWTAMQSDPRPEPVAMGIQKWSTVAGQPQAPQVTR